MIIDSSSSHTNEYIQYSDMLSTIGELKLNTSLSYSLHTCTDSSSVPKSLALISLHTDSLEQCALESAASQTESMYFPGYRMSREI